MVLEVVFDTVLAIGGSMVALLLVVALSGLVWYAFHRKLVSRNE